MFAALRKRQPGASVAGILYRACIRELCRLWVAVFYRGRLIGAENIPLEGPVLIASNHQSFLDPIILGVGGWTRRQWYFLARSTLFNNRLIGLGLRSLNTIPVERGAGDIKAIRGVIELLKAGQAIAIYPEGTRTEDGEMQPFKSGLMLLVKRTRATVVPTAVEGTFAIWPRNRSRPRLTGRAGVHFGEPISAETLLAMDSDAALDLVQQKVASMRQEMADQFRDG